MKKLHDNISPLDSRYAGKIESTRSIFSEANLIKIRFELEIDWLIFLCSKLPSNFPTPVSYTHLTLPTTRCG